MKKTSMFKFAIIGVLGLGMMCGEVFAKSYSGSRGFSRSSTPSRSYSSTKSSTIKYSKTSTGNSSKYKPSIGVGSSPKATAPKMKKSAGGFGKKKVNTNSAQYKKTNAQIKKDFGTSNKKYKDMKEAKAELGSKMASKRYTYKDSTTAMANRPAHIPPSYNGHTTVYINGGYGYMSAGEFVPYIATHMIITDAMMRSYAPNAYQTHVVHHHSNTGTVIVGVLIAVMIISGIFMVVTINRS